jgi:hypothetical protein
MIRECRTHRPYLTFLDEWYDWTKLLGGVSASQDYQIMDDGLHHSLKVSIRCWNHFFYSICSCPHAFIFSKNMRSGAVRMWHWFRHWLGCIEHVVEVHLRWHTMMFSHSLLRPQVCRIACKSNSWKKQRVQRIETYSLTTIVPSKLAPSTRC